MKILASIRIEIILIFLCRNKAHNGAQLLVVMADVYNNYLRLRLSDVILKRETSSKAAITTVPLSAVTHIGGAVYRVNSASQEDILYTVDLSIGTCSCLSGNTGSVCKHQLAASQYSAVRLPQLYACTAAEKKKIFRIIYGDQAMPAETFFDSIYTDTPANETEHVESVEVMEISTDQQIAASDQINKNLHTVEVIENANENLEQRIDSFTSMLNKELKRNKSTCILKSLDVFEQRMKACKNPAQVSSLLRTAGWTLFKASGAYRKKIPCQPTSIARRKSGQPRGKATLLKGKIVKRKRNLALNISKNVPNAKIH